MRWVAVARAANSLFFVLTAAYCILTYSAFAYQQFIRPRLVATLSDFVAFHHLWHWVLLGITVTTLLPEWRNTRGRAVAWVYVAAMGLLGLLLLYRPILPAVENDARGLWLACGFLLPPIVLAVYDHLATGRAFAPAPVETRRLALAACASAVVVWGVSAASVPLRFSGLGDITTTRNGLVFGALVSLAAHLAVFLTIGTLIAAVLMAAGRATHAARLQYWVIAVCAAALCLLTVKALVFGSLSFAGTSAWIVAIELAAALTATWSGVARRLAEARPVRATAFEIWLAPIPGAQSDAGALAGLVILPVAAFVVLKRVERFDWDFLVQSLCVIVAWLLTCALVHALVRRRAPRLTSGPVVLTSAFVVAVAGVGVDNRVSASASPSLRAAGEPFVSEFALDAYASLDPSYRLLRRLLSTESAGAREFYAYLGANSLIQHVDVEPVQVDFVTPLVAAPTPPPHIFLFVVDSLRRDYVSAYNPRVTFTPAFAQFARDGFAFRRAFTGYGGTGLSMPAIWAGSMLLHKEYVLPFQPMNALEKLINANGYRPVMSMDHITAQLVAPDLQVDQLDRGRDEMHFDFCSTLTELQEKLDTGIAEQQPVFAHTRSLNLHISKLTQRTGAPVPAYGGFQPPAAAAVQRMDACFGRFISYLQERKLYDDSIVILTADHGDALGEAKRWGHAYTLFPEIVRTPLLVHVPSRLRAQFTADVDAISLSTDITPSLYALLGYRTNPPEWPLGRSLFVPPGVDTSWRRREPVLVASSYGPVYGVLRDNGESLYIADGVNRRDYAYDLHELEPRRVGVTPEARADNRAFIREKVGALASLYHFMPAQ